MGFFLLFDLLVRLVYHHWVSIGFTFVTPSCGNKHLNVCSSLLPPCSFILYWSHLSQWLNQPSTQPRVIWLYTSCGRSLSVEYILCSIHICVYIWGGFTFM